MENVTIEQPALPTITSGQVYNARTPAGGLEIETEDEIAVLDAEWHQIGGDVSAHTEGCIFGQVDHNSERVWDVEVVEILYTPARDENWRDPDGNYLAECSSVDVDNMDWRRMRPILESCGWLYRQHERETGGADEPVKVPEDVWNRVWACEMRVCELRNLARWQGRKLREAEVDQVAADIAEAETLRAWYSLPRVMRAEAAVHYGGYTDGQSLYFHTLREAMDYHDIPAAALLDPKCYQQPDPNTDDDTDFDHLDEQTQDEPGTPPAV